MTVEEIKEDKNNKGMVTRQTERKAKGEEDRENRDGPVICVVLATTPRNSRSIQFSCFFFSTPLPFYSRDVYSDDPGCDIGATPSCVQTIGLPSALHTCSVEPGICSVDI